MAELADEWASKGIGNIWGNIPEAIEMQSEGGAAGTVHGTLTTTPAWGQIFPQNPYPTLFRLVARVVVE